MQCPRCYDEEVIGAGLSRVVKKSFLEMEAKSSDFEFDYHQCPRCLTMRKQRRGFGYAKIIESVSPEETTALASKNTGGEGLGAVLLLGAVALVGMAVISSDVPKKP